MDYISTFNQRKKEQNRIDNQVYYRLYINRDDEPVVVCMQWFDEYDYDQSRFINTTRYTDEEEAEQALVLEKQKLALPLSNVDRIRMVRRQEKERY